jgi:hypothetical protein
LIHLPPSGFNRIDDSAVFSSTSTLLEVPDICVA